MIPPPIHGTNITVTDKRSGDVKVLAVLLVIRTSSNVKGVLALAAAQRVVEARILTRCCLENEIRIANLISEGDAFARKMLRHGISVRQARDQFVSDDPSARFGIRADVPEGLRAWIKQSRRM